MNKLQQHSLKQKANMQAFLAGGAAAGDYDNDGWVDLYVTRLDDTDLLFRNQGDGTFSNATLKAFGPKPIIAATNGAQWGDIDNDGDLDLISSGFTGIETDLTGTEYIDPITNVYQQNSQGQFVLDTTLYMLDSVGLSSTQWGDYDNDGDLDLLITGETSEDQLITRVYENLEGFTNPNTIPSKPIMLMSDVNIDSVHISWQSGIDLENSTGTGRTPDIGMKYQLQMGDDQNYDLLGNTHSIISGDYGTGRMGSRSCLLYTSDAADE